MKYCVSPSEKRSKCVVIAFLLLVLATSAQPQGTTNGNFQTAVEEEVNSAKNNSLDCQAQIRAGSLEKIAKDFRAEISYSYALSRSLPPIESRKILTASAKKYFCRGLSFSTAEEVLISAGFIVNADPTNFPPRKGMHYVRTDASLMIESSILASTSVYINISLIPVKPNDFSEIGEVVAFTSSVSP